MSYTSISLTNKPFFQNALPSIDFSHTPNNYFFSGDATLAIVYFKYESNFYIRITEKAKQIAKRKVERALLYSEGEAFSFKHGINHV